MGDIPAIGTGRLRIGKFEVLPAERILSASGRSIEIGARAFDLLLVLIEHAGRLATKDLLLERVWPRLVVEENNLAAQIANLRRVLGAGAIKTVAGYGYRLELPVSADDSASAITSKSTATPARQEAIPLSPSRPDADRLGAIIGRDRELEELKRLIELRSLVAIVGVAGAGKSRMAREIAARSREQLRIESAWVSLQAIRDIELVPSALALSLGVPLPREVDGFTSLQRLLEQSNLLLILDGVEHLGDPLASRLSELVQQTRGLRLLVTSQAPLGIPGEAVYRLSTLSVPAAGDSLEQAIAHPAISLFVQRAAAADQRFSLQETNLPQVAEICRRLDGNALAIELAAARVPALGISGLLERLDDRFRLLKVAHPAADARHGTLHAAFDWSYGLLTAAEQRVFSRLAVFDGSFPLRVAVQCVVDDSIDELEAVDLIGRLVDRSLVTSVQMDPPRYRLLETARHFALERLRASQQLEATRERMARAMLALLDTAFQEYWSMDEALWLHRYEGDLDNLRTAMDWATEHDAELAVALYGSAWPLFVEADLHAEARRRFEQAVARIRDNLPRERIGRFWNAVATYDSTRQLDRARYAAEVAARMHAGGADPRAHYYALTMLALNWRGDEAASRAAFESARRLEDAAWPPRLLAQGAVTDGALLSSSGEFATAREAYTRAMRLALTTSERMALAASVAIVELDIACGELGSALQLARPLALSLRHSGRLETRFELLTLLFAALLLSGETDEARDAGAELHQLALRFDTSRLYLALDAMACLACADGRAAAAARVLAASDRAHAAHGPAERRPVERRMLAVAAASVAQSIGADAVAGARGAGELDENSACALALGLIA